MNDADRTLTTYQGFYANSIANPETFWARQAELIEWQKKKTSALPATLPGIEAGVRGMRFIDRSIQSSKHQGWVAF